MLPYIAEFLGTMILIILGDGVVANVTLNKSGMKGGGTVQITFAWGLAVMLPACIFGAASGASFNPALTLALAIDGSFAWSMVPGYILAQFAGAFAGGVIVYLLFKGQFEQQKIKLPNLECSVQHHRFQNLDLTFSVKRLEHLYLYLQSKEWRMCRNLQMDLVNLSYLESSFRLVCHSVV